MRDFIPQESETIAVKRDFRLKNKFNLARQKFFVKKAWWSNGPIEILGLLVIFIFNFYIIYPVFGTPAVETTFSGPLIPLLASSLGVFDIKEIFAVQIFNIVFYLFLPLTFYFFVKKLSERKIVAFLATLLISVPFRLFAKSRIEYSILGIESPHIASLTIIPLSLLGLLAFLREGGLKNLTMTSVFGAIIALISPFGFFIYLIFAVITSFSEILLGSARQKVVRFIFVILITASLCSFWYDPVFFLNMVFGPAGEEVRITANKLIPISFFLFPVLATFGYLFFDRKPNLQPVFLAGFYSIAFTVIFIAGKGIFPSHPGRYIPELGFSYSFLLAYLIYVLIQKVVNLSLLKNFLSSGFLLTLLTTLFIGSLILISIPVRKKIFLNTSQVLGFSTSLPKGKIWLAKEEFLGSSSFLGYAISLVSIFTLVYLNISALKRELNLTRPVKNRVIS